MHFTAIITAGTCSVCSLDLGNDALVHQEGGERCAIHRKCLDAWVKIQTQTVANPKPLFCLTCNKNIDSIESKGEALIRMARQGDEVAIKTFMKNDRFGSCYDLAAYAAAQNGHDKVVEALLENGSISNTMCGLALERATENGHLEVVKLLLHKRQMRWEHVPDDSLEKSLNMAKEKGHEQIVQELQPSYQICQLFKKCTSVEEYKRECELSLRDPTGSLGRSVFFKI